MGQPQPWLNVLSFSKAIPLEAIEMPTGRPLGSGLYTCAKYEIDPSMEICITMTYMFASSVGPLDRHFLKFSLRECDRLDRC